MASRLEQKLMTSEEAVNLIKDGDSIWVNAFLGIANADALHEALTKRVLETGKPENLNVYCSAGFGNWHNDSPLEGYIKAGAVKRMLIGHLSSMPQTVEKIKKNEMEAYNLPLGVMSHMIRAAASKKPYIFSKVGLNLYVDPRNGGPGLNSLSTDKWVELTEIDGQEMLYYKIPHIDIAFIRGTSADEMGNISFEKECSTLDALSTAQAVKACGGKVLVQVERTIDYHVRPRDVIIPGMLVDAIILCPTQNQLINNADYNPAFSGDEYTPPGEIAAWINAHTSQTPQTIDKRDVTQHFLAKRAAKELKAGDIVNIGVGIPELVAKNVAETPLINDITMTVEAGAVGGMPASGYSFGATFGADCIYDMAQQFDFYDGGGLDICFIGALEVDKYGNVNGHYNSAKLSGIGGFANITQSTKKVVFCFNFTSGGLKAEVDGDSIKIINEGKYKKFVDKVSSVSFSGKNAIKNNQTILYVTERCVFQLTEKGLKLKEVSKGIDVEKDILSLLPFEVIL